MLEDMGRGPLAEKYSYLQGSFTNDDYVRVGKDWKAVAKVQKHETGYLVAGVKEELEWNYSINEDLNGTLLVGLNAHTEQFFNQEIGQRFRSRFSRSGEIVKDQKYLFSAFFRFVKNQITYKKLSVSADASLRAGEYAKIQPIEYCL